MYERRGRADNERRRNNVYVRARNGRCGAFGRFRFNAFEDWRGIHNSGYRR